jgi:hypothetical protein
MEAGRRMEKFFPASPCGSFLFPPVVVMKFEAATETPLSSPRLPASM